MARSGRGYYFDKAKDRWISRIMRGGKIHSLGSFINEQDASDAVKDFLNNKKEGMPRRRTTTEQKTQEFSLNDAIEFIDKLKNPISTKSLYKRCLINLTRYGERIEEDEEGTDLTLEEITAIYGEVNLVEILNDYERTQNIIEEEIKNSRNGEDISIDTKKHYYSAINSLFNNLAGRLRLGKDLETQYQERMSYWSNESNKKRRMLLPKDYAIEYPDFNWETMVKEYNEFIDTKKFTNTEAGRKDLRRAVIVGMYILNIPRRVEDFWKLQWFSKQPTDEQQKDRNLVWLRKEKGVWVGTFYIDKFKIRRMVTKNKQREVLPRFIKDIHPRLADLMGQYVKFWNIKDMAKVSTQEKREEKNYYMFYPDDKKDPSVPYSQAGGYGDQVVKAMKKIFNDRIGISTNAFRHNYADWISRNIKEYNDEKLREIAIGMGDTFKDLPTNLRYRFAEPENQDKAITEIGDQIHGEDYARQLFEANAEEEGSVAGEPQNERQVEQMEIINDDELSELKEVSAGDAMTVNEIYAKLGQVVAKMNEFETRTSLLALEKERLLRLLVGQN